MGDFLAVWNYGKLSAKFLVSSIKVIDMVRLLSFLSSLIYLLKFLLNTFNYSKGWSISASVQKLRPPYKSPAWLQPASEGQPFYGQPAINIYMTAGANLDNPSCQ